MQVICISRGTYSGGKQLAEGLARKLGCDCLSREELAETATAAGIPLGKLEMAVQRRRPLNEWLHIQKERFKAFTAGAFAERALKGGFVYHGRHGHAQLPGVSHIMRVRAILDPEIRDSLTMERLDLSLEKAKRYNQEVDEDRNRWVRTIYNVNAEDPFHYDAVINLSRVNVGNAAAALAEMAQLPEFHASPVDVRVLGDISLASRCRLAIADDPRTLMADVNVKASSGHVVVSYPFRQASLAPLFPKLLEKVEGVKQVVCTLASTNLLWIQERFDPHSELFEQVLDIAQRWDASVDLLQVAEAEGEKEAGKSKEESREAELLEAAQKARKSVQNGGILDASFPVDATCGDEPAAQTMSRLAAAGRGGSYLRVEGGTRDLTEKIEPSSNYSLVVVGNAFLGKPGPVRKRMTQELIGALSHKLRVPTVGAEDLKRRYALGPGFWVKLLLHGAVAAILVALVFLYQAQVLQFLTHEGRLHRIGATACLLVFVPFFAYLYGNFSGSLLRFFGFD